MKALDDDISTLEKKELIQALTPIISLLLSPETEVNSKDWYILLKRMNELVNHINILAWKELLKPNT